MLATHASKEVVWLHILGLEIEFKHKSMRLGCDSQSAIFLKRNPTYHSKMKHIYVQYHFVRDMVERNKVLLKKVGILENVLDSSTKYVRTKKFSWCREAMGISTLDC